MHNGKRIAVGLDQVFHYCLLGILLFSSIIYFFVFVINWEAWFFGMKMDGLNAGIILFTYCLIASSLAYLLIRYPRKIAAIAGISIFYFGFIFIDSAVTIQERSGGQELFSPFLAIVVMIPVGILIGYFLVSRIDKTDSSTTGRKDSSRDDRPVAMTVVTEKSDEHTIGQILILAVVAFLLVILFGPLVVSLISMVFSSLHTIVSPSVPVLVGDSLITKVDSNGTTEWQTLVNGQPVSYLEVCPSQDGGFVISGMFRLAGQTGRSLRVMKLDHNGTLIWDIHRGNSAYPETDLDNIKMLLPTAGEYTVIMLNGIVIRLDDEGNEVWHRYYPHDTHVVNSISLPDGGYVLIGDANEEGPEGWKKFDGWILYADREGNTVWEKKEKDFTYCRRAAVSPEGNLLVSCYANCYDPDVSCSESDKSGNVIVAFDPQGNYLWKQKFVEKDDGVIYSMKPLDNGAVEVHLRGEGEQKYTLDHEGNVLKKELLPPRPDSFNHEIALYLTYESEPLAKNRTQLKVRDGDGSESVFVIDYPMNLSNVSRICSVNPTSDGGYIVVSSQEQ